MKAHEIKIGGRVFPLAFTLKTMIQLQEEIEDFDLDNVGKIVSSASGMRDMLYALAVGGAALNDQKLDVGKDWFAAKTPASAARIAVITSEIIETIADYMMMETDKEDEGEEVDVTLQEIKKNGPADG